MSNLRFTGKFTLYRISAKGIILGRVETPNTIMLAAVDDILNKYFRNGTPPTNWYMGLIGGTTVTITDTDSMSSHGGWTEDQNYSESTRQEWAPNASASQILDNSTSVTFTMNADTTVRGLFIVSDNTKGGTSGTLWSAAELDTVQELLSGQKIRGFFDLTGSGV